MKLNSTISHTITGFSIFIFSHTFANTMIVGGMVPTLNNLEVTPLETTTIASDLLSNEIALIQIENNLPNFQLVLDFSSAMEAENKLSEVKLESVSGTLGGGLVAPQKLVLSNELGSSKYIWNPGPQVSATLGYVVKVSVTYKAPPKKSVVMSVSMPTSL